MLASPLTDERIRLAKVVVEEYKTYCFWSHADNTWTHNPWVYIDDATAQLEWESVADDHGFDETDETMKTFFLECLANTTAYYTNLIALDPNWSPFGDGEDSSVPIQVPAMADEGDDPINID